MSTLELIGLAAIAILALAVVGIVTVLRSDALDGNHGMGKGVKL